MKLTKVTKGEIVLHKNYLIKCRGEWYVGKFSRPYVDDDTLAFNPNWSCSASWTMPRLPNKVYDMEELWRVI